MSVVVVEQLCPSRGPVEGFVRLSLGFAVVKVSYILTTSSYFDNLEFDIFEITLRIASELLKNKPEHLKLFAFTFLNTTGQGSSSRQILKNIL